MSAEEDQAFIDKAVEEARQKLLALIPEGYPRTLHVTIRPVWAWEKECAGINIYIQQHGALQRITHEVTEAIMTQNSFNKPSNHDLAFVEGGDCLIYMTPETVYMTLCYDIEQALYGKETHTLKFKLVVEVE